MINADENNSLPHRPSGRLYWVLPSLGCAAADRALRYDQPVPNSAQGVDRAALPIGNGRIGGSLFGQLACERERRVCRGLKLTRQPFRRSEILHAGADASLNGFSNLAATHTGIWRAWQLSLDLAPAEPSAPQPGRQARQVVKTVR
jgi:hypothetical protein